MPAISSFEDKLMVNNDHNERIDVMMRRLDEIICNKSDRVSLKEFRDFVETNYITKEENKSASEGVITNIADFGNRVTAMEEMVKF